MFRTLTAALVTVTVVVTASALSPASSSASTAQWTQSGVTIAGLAGGDETGSAVALSADGDIVAIGEPQSQIPGRGRVRVFSGTTGTWTQVGASLVGATDGDFFGTAVALSADGLTLAVGAPGFDITGTLNAGRVTVYRYDGTAWVPTGDPIVGTSTTKALGSSVALCSDGNRVAIGAPQGGTASEGATLVFDFTTAWTQVGATILGEVASALSGTSVALGSDGSRLAIGAVGNTSSAGQARVFALSAGSWSQLGSSINGAAAGDNLGRSVDLNGAGDVLAVGIPGHDATGSNAGQVGVYGYDGSAWVVRGAAINGVAAGDNFGYSVALSSSGTRVTAGAPLADNPGSSAGEVRTFAFAGGSWGVLGQSVTGESAGDEAGHSVAISSAGARIAIGAPEKSTTTGQVRVFAYPEPAPSAASVASTGLAGIALHVAGPVGRPVEGSPVYVASHKVASFSPYVVRLTRESAPRTSVILASGVTDARGMVSRRLTLGALAPGTYTLTLTGRHVFGTGLWLTTTFSVTQDGTYGSVSENAHGIW